MSSEINLAEKISLYIEIQTESCLYSISRSGFSKELVYFESLLDVVNAEFVSESTCL